MKNYKKMVVPGLGGAPKKGGRLAEAKEVSKREAGDLARRVSAETAGALQGKMEIMRTELPFTVVNALVFLLGGFGSLWVSATTTGSNETPLFVWKGIGIFVGFVVVWWVVSQVTGKAFGAWGKAITLLVVLGFFMILMNLGPIFGVVQILILLIVGGIGFFAYKSGVIRKVLGAIENFSFRIGQNFSASTKGGK
mgnify:CR=1 FL=1